AAQLRHMCPQPIDVVADVSPDLRVPGSPGELHQVLLNLFINARDAMPSGGTITVVASRVFLERDAAAEEHVPGGDYVQVRVRDTGTGMTEEVLARAFEPFFTTKAGRGTGLGL